jgi:hypothetical protein
MGVDVSMQNSFTQGGAGAMTSPLSKPMNYNQGTYRNGFLIISINIIGMKGSHSMKNLVKLSKI